MASALESLIATGTKLWLDSIDPDLVIKNRALGATGATSLVISASPISASIASQASSPTIAPLGVPLVARLHAHHRVQAAPLLDPA